MRNRIPLEELSPDAAWIASIARGLLVALRTDIDVFLMAVAGLLLGGRRGMGKALLFYLAVRQSQNVTRAWINQTNQIARSIGDGRQQAPGP